MANATMLKFGHPATLIADYTHWVVLLRPAAVTLGSLVMVAKSEATRFGDLPPEAFAEQARVVADVEAALRAVTEYEKINYLMLMMVDPHVHCHVIPRYVGTRSFDGIDYCDRGWPGMPDLAGATPLDMPTQVSMIDRIKSAWPSLD